MTNLHSGWKGLGLLLALAAALGAAAALLPGAGGAAQDLPPLSRFGFAAALILIAQPVLRHLWQPPGPDRPRAAALTRAAALFATFWFLAVAILNDLALPSAEALPWLGAAAGFGLLMAALAARPPARADTAPARIAAPLLLAAATAALALLPVMSGTAAVLFTLTLAFALADRRPWRDAAPKGPDTARLALAATALAAALAAAR